MLRGRRRAARPRPRPPRNRGTRDRRRPVTSRGPDARRGPRAEPLCVEHSPLHDLLASTVAPGGCVLGLERVDVLPHLLARRGHLEQPAHRAVDDQRVAVGEALGARDRAGPPALVLRRAGVDGGEALGEVGAVVGARRSRPPSITGVISSTVGELPDALVAVVEHEDVPRAGQALGDPLRVVLVEELSVLGRTAVVDGGIAPAEAQVPGGAPCRPGGERVVDHPDLAGSAEAHDDLVALGVVLDGVGVQPVPGPAGEVHVHPPGRVGHDAEARQPGIAVLHEVVPDPPFPHDLVGARVDLDDLLGPERLVGEQRRIPTPRDRPRRGCGAPRRGAGCCRWASARRRGAGGGRGSRTRKRQRTLPSQPIFSMMPPRPRPDRKTDFGDFSVRSSVPSGGGRRRSRADGAPATGGRPARPCRRGRCRSC